MINLNRALSNWNIGQTQLESILKILQAALDSVDPSVCVKKSLQLDGNHLNVCDQIQELDSRDRISIISFGKASVCMTQAAVELLRPRLERVLCICKHLPVQKPDWPNAIILQGSHPVPDGKSKEAAAAVREILQTSTSDDVLLFLISGGGSALIADPVDGITVDELQQMTDVLLQCGASIFEINCIRKHVENLKGGKSVKLAPESRIISLILSDVVGNPLDVIASGMTVPDSSTFRDAWNILKKYDITQKIAPSIVLYLYEGLQGCQSETPKSFKPNPERIHNSIIGSNEIAASAAQCMANTLGWDNRILTNSLCGEAQSAGVQLAEWMKQISNQPKPALWVAGGETTVSVKGKGRGGRNLETALSAVRSMAGLQNCALITFATDGEDGPTDAAGALVTGDTYEKAKAMRLDPDAYLANNDSYSFFEQLDQLLITGPTGTNVNDLNFLFRFPEPE